MTKWPKGIWSSLCEGSCGIWSHLIAYNRKIQSGKTPFGVVNFKSTFASLDHSILGIVSISCNAHTHIKKDENLQTFICTTWCVYTKRLKLALMKCHGIAHIGNGSPTKQSKHKKLTRYAFMLTLFFPCLVQVFFRRPILNVGYYFNANFARLVKTSSWWSWFISSSSITIPTPTSMWKMW